MVAVAKSICPSGSAIAEGSRCASRAVCDVSGAEKCLGRWLGEPFDRGRDLIRARNVLQATLRWRNLCPHSQFAFPKAFIWERSGGVAPHELPPSATQQERGNGYEPRLARGVSEGLSCVRGNSHAQFLGGGSAARRSCYPTHMSFFVLKSPWMLLVAIPLGFTLLAAIAASQAGEWTGASTVFATCAVLAFGVGGLSALRVGRSTDDGRPPHATAETTDELASFVHRVRRRNVRDTVLAFLFVAWYGYALSTEPLGNLASLGRVVLVVTWLAVLGVIWGCLNIPPADLVSHPPGEDPARWWSYLTAQVRGLRLAWLWAGLPLLIGFGLEILGGSDVAPWGTAVWLAIVFAAVGWLSAANLLAAARLVRDRDRWLGGTHPAKGDR
jgi:hypothetical protein